ncbi:MULTISPECIES: TRAP transporter large permease [unclassified Agarivorans]|uniref:TRAP transporter large permease n=1 Tax=unclassified Agarivorans TaxID=2636026 RepID=UPI0010E37042|nr:MULTISPECIES: TRAP transporter large permease [unclassified Agarivorans]MDO6686507.1 TRAP transporter large permease [Agarivorans sp. 3_MG-2023]MDO6715325.1 TRAP transporter large permease [Agarivorans sp. 2_MG-2023]MDO6763358.1 TRAP transporter large permease [Agarivorans sp. 1_MG-2023]GDY26210.1 C4-dicarboxylate ABC transporter permease [Agarivorans sp. Toyoura001]
MGLLILMAVFVVGVIIGTPVAFALGIAAVSAFAFEGLPLLIAFQRITAGISVFSLMAIPFFIFAGELMFHGGIAMRLVRFASSAVGAVRGGLGVVNVMSSMLFGGISGSAVADISALGSILIPVMKKKGYDEDYAVNVTVTSSIAGIMIPPSHNMILYAVAAGGGISISQLFLAGVVPGVLMCICLAITAYIVAVKRGYAAETFPGFTVLFTHFVVALPGLLTAVIIVGGVLSGVFTVTESGAFGTIYALVVTVLVYRELTWQKFKTAVVNSVKTTSMVMVLIACAAAFAYMLTYFQVPSKMIDFLGGISDNPIVIILLINVMLLLLGMVMDMAALILICTPIFLPVAQSLGIDPLQFGMILMMNLGLGLCTPPVGACLFVGCAVGKVPMESAVKSIWPFYIAILFALVLTTFIPAVSLALPTWLAG